MPTILGANTSSTAAYEVANSCRFNDGDSAYMTKTPGSDGNRQTFTISVWLKRGTLGSQQNILGSSDSNFGNGLFFQFQSDDTFRFGFQDPNQFKATNRVFRDTSAWYNIIVAVDVNQASNSYTVKIYINGTQETSFATDNTMTDVDKDWNNQQAHSIGRSGAHDAQYFDGYLAEVVSIDGSQLAATSFGEFDDDSPRIWKPIDVSGLTFGTNGFYLDFEDSSNLGNDANGGTDLTENNLAATDQSSDTCTNNFVTWNPLDNTGTYSGTIDLSEGNLRQSSGSDASLISTIALNSGKWYMEFKCEDADNTRTFGIIDITESNRYVGHSSVASAVSYGYKSSDGTLWIGTSSQASSVGTTSAGDIVSIALDLDSATNSIKWQKNGSDLSGTTELSLTNHNTGYYWGIICRCDGGQVVSANFGSPAYAISSGNADANGYGNFEYAVPDGYLALCTKNLGSDGG